MTPDTGQHQEAETRETGAGRTQFAQQVVVFTERDAVAGVEGVRREEDERADGERGQAGKAERDLLEQ